MRSVITSFRDHVWDMGARPAMPPKSNKEHPLAADALAAYGARGPMGREALKSDVSPTPQQGPTGGPMRRRGFVQSGLAGASALASIDSARAQQSGDKSLTKHQPFSGWAVYCDDISDDQAHRLGRYFAAAAAILPKPVLLVTQKASVFLHNSNAKWTKCEGRMSFHWSKTYLEDARRDGAMAGSIEVHDVNSVIDMLENEWSGSVIHELGHAFHFHYPHFNINHMIHNTFRHSRNLPCYTNSRSVFFGDIQEPIESYAVKGSKESQYKEYFACLFASYFNMNNYLPVSRKQLKTGDPEGFALIDNLIKNC